MIIVDTALKKLEAEGKPLKVAIVGAGFIGRGCALSILKYLPGMDVVAISNRTIARGENAYREAGVEDFVRVESVSALEESIARGKRSLTDDALLLAQAEGVDVVMETTGDVELGAKVTLACIENRKHIVMANAELDATVGPILNHKAKQAGIIYSNCDGDQPGVVMNLYRFVESLGYRPCLAGNIKGLLDPYRTPETQAAFAKANLQSPEMATSFADGTKISMEMAVVANATGLRAGKRGMHGPEVDHVDNCIDLFPRDQLENGGIVDYVIGAKPGPGVFVIGFNDNPLRSPYMKYFKLGAGPFHVFYIPYHLPHLEFPLTAARAALFADATIAPIAGPVGDCITIAKRDLTAGQTLDGIGGFDTYGVLENTDVAAKEGLLPMGVSGGCKLTRPIAKDQAITVADVEIPGDRVTDELWKEQNAHFGIEYKGLRWS